MSEVEGKVGTTGELVKCSACGKEYYYKADKYPNCGKRSPQDIKAQMKYFIIIGIILVVVTIVSVIYFGQNVGFGSYSSSARTALDEDIKRSANALRGYGVDPDALEPGWNSGGGTTGAKPATSQEVSRTEGDFEVYTYTTWDDSSIKGYVGNGGAVTIPAMAMGKPVTSVTLRSENITSVTIPDGVTWVHLEGCTGLTSVAIPNSVTSIDHHAFSHCTSLVSVTIPDSVTSIWRYAFAGCTNLTSVTIPNSVTSIDHHAFSRCTSLVSVAISDSVMEIGERVFWDCSNLVTVTISPKGRKWDKDGFFAKADAFEGCPQLSSESKAALKKAGYKGKY